MVVGVPFGLHASTPPPPPPPPASDASCAKLLSVLLHAENCFLLLQRHSNPNALVHAPLQPFRKIFFFTSSSVPLLSTDELAVAAGNNEEVPANLPLEVQQLVGQRAARMQADAPYTGLHTCGSLIKCFQLLHQFTTLPQVVHVLLDEAHVVREIYTSLSLCIAIRSRGFQLTTAGCCPFKPYLDRGPDKVPAHSRLVILATAPPPAAGRGGRSRRRSR